MRQTTKKYIVVFIIFILTQTSVFAQYNGGSGDGAVTDSLRLTTCGFPTNSYAYFGGVEDGANNDLLMNTTCGTPPQFFAYMGGNDDGSGVDLLNLTTCSTPAQFFAYMGGTNDGAHADALTLTTCNTPAQFFAYMGGNGDGFSRDTFVVCPTYPPVANFSVNTTSVCAGNTVTFTDLSTNSPVNWAWTFSGGTPTTSTLQNPSVTYTTPGVYSVSLTVTNAFGSNAITKTSYITVNAIPVADAGSNVSICNGSSTALVASGGTTYSWSPPTGLSSTTIVNPVANPTVTTTYTVNVTQNGCSKTDVVTVTVLPFPNANAGPNVLLCLGTPTTLVASGGTTYSWTPSTGLNSTTIANPIANPTITTNYTVTVGNGVCSTQDVMTVSVSPIPVVSAGTNTTICSGSSTTFTASSGTSYSWSPASSLNFSNIASPVASPTTTTNYTVAISNGTCAANAFVSVSVTPLPIANAGSDAAICNGGTTTLTASGGTTYSWTPSAGLSSTSIANPMASPSVTTNYTVIVTNNGCSATDVVNVTVTNLLTASAGTNTAICNGSSTVLNASGGSTYSWLPATGLSATNIFNPVASPTITTIYTVTASSGGCSSTDAVTITVNALPTASISASGTTTFCAGNNIVLSSTSGSSYLWSNGAITPSITVTTSGNYSVTVTNASNCSATSNVIAVTVYTPAVASITPSGATNFCQGGNVLLTATAGSGYHWSTSATTQSINVSTSGIYSVTVDDINGCASSSASITIVVNPNPPTPVITASGTTSLCIGDTVTLSSDAANSYLWSSGATSYSINITTAGSYSVTNYNSFGCGTISNGIQVSVNDPVSDFSATPLLVFTPNAVTSFSATTTGFAPYTYLWDFGDFTTSILSAPSHTYAYSTLSAYRTISLTVTDNTGCSKTITKPNYIEVEQLFPSTAMTTGTSIDITGVSFEDPTKGILTLADGNCLISIDSGKVWNPLPTGNTQALTGGYVMPGKWFVTGVNGTILSSIDDGVNWIPFSTGTTETFNGSHFSSASNGFAVGTNGTIHKFTGALWNPETSGTLEHLNNVYAFSNGNAVAVGENQTILSYNGSSWSPQLSPLNFHIKDVRFSTSLNGYAVGTGGIVLQTTDGGANWLPALTGVDVDFNSIEVKTDTAWATGTGGIVYKTIDNGANWIRYSVGYTNTQSQLRVTGGGKGHVVGGSGNGRYFNNNPGNGTPTSIRANADVFNHIKLYPNPAKDHFIISGYLESSEKVVIEIKDAQAKLVKSILNTTLSGEYHEKISTEYYSQGIYFIHIQIGERSMVKKLVVMK